ncbi:hypothetical protein ACG2F4_05565, partial [Halalkalibaculum sp. DA3122]|uniref:hypothetical protein n=1 Tax=Halalkalibaculum sp. DA3122 TaxID=3373607 RepID=UPI0037546ECF
RNQKLKAVNGAPAAACAGVDVDGPSRRLPAIKVLTGATSTNAGFGLRAPFKAGKDQVVYFVARSLVRQHFFRYRNNCLTRSNDHPFEIHHF